MSTECSQLPESHISCPANWPRTSANTMSWSAAVVTAVDRTLSRVSAAASSAVRSWVLSPMQVLDLDRSYRSGYPSSTILALGACCLMACRVLASLAGNWVVAKFLAAATALTHELVDLSTQVSITLEKPASLPPIVMLTSVVPALSADTWPLITSEVVAPAHATETNEAGVLAPAHCSG